MRVRGHAKKDDMIFEGLFLATVSTVDATPTTIYQFTPANPSLVRVEASVLGVGLGADCSFGKIGTFKNVLGTVTLIGSVATLGAAEDNGATDVTLTTDGTSIFLKVVGIVALNMNWRVIGGTIYQS